MLSSQKSDAIQEQIDQIIALTSPFPMTERLAFKIYHAYGPSAVERLKQNPYVLARDVFGIGEQTAAKIAEAIEAKLDTTFSPQVARRSKAVKRNYGGPGNGKLSAEKLEHLKAKLRSAPQAILPQEWTLNDPAYWTIPDLKRAVQFWFGVTWAHDSSYRNLFKKCGLVYDRRRKSFIHQQSQNK